MKIYKSPRTKRWEKHREEEIDKKIKKNTPKPIYYTTSEGKKIKYIPCDVDYQRELESTFKPKPKRKKRKRQPKKR